MDAQRLRWGLRDGGSAGGASGIYRELRYMETCDTCRFWDRQKRLHFVHCRCHNEKLNRYDGDDTACDEGGPECEGIHTGPKFGCVNHEPCS